MSRTHTASTQERALLARQLAVAQHLDDMKAAELAERVLCGPEDIAQAALEWARSGEMPSRPEVAGQTPHSLSGRFAPSQVFTGLMLLRSDPQSGAQVLRRGVDRHNGTERHQAREKVSTTASGEGVLADRKVHEPRAWQEPAWFLHVFPLIALVALAAVSTLTLTGTLSVSFAVAALAAVVAALVLRTSR
jgi:hypothetical protein